jgi:molybdopterin-guanine dinucleotide biosynthesis protein A
MGMDKAQLRFPGGALLDRMRHAVGAVAEPLVLALAAKQVLEPLPAGVHTVRDATPFEGPLWGLAEGFRLLQGQAEQVLVTPVDLPFFTPAWIQPLLDGMAGHDVCLYRWEGVVNPLVGVYRLSLLDKLERLIAAGLRRPLALSTGSRTRHVELESLWTPEQGPAPLMDVDTLAEGIGDRTGAEITVQVHAPPGLNAATIPLPLRAAHADQIVPWVLQLYPDWMQAARSAGRGPVVHRDGDSRGGGGTVPADLHRGDRLRLDWR